MVFLCAATSAVFAQKTLTGKVTGAADGAPLPGVNVTVPGTASGASTDTKGNYTLSLPPGAKSVLFSFIGYEPQTVTIGEQTVINVSLAAATKGLGEVVVVGYGVQSRRDVTGTIASVKGSDIKNLPVSDAAQAIQGRVTGVDIVRSDAAPGSTPSIRIRGTGTINNSDPLIIIDGVPAGGLADVSPNDIASMEILKDASSSAIYGTRAANGVVIITTKRGNYGEKLKASVNFYRGVSNTVRYIPLLTAPDLVKLKQERYTNDGVPIEPIWQDPYYATQRTDWQKALFGSGDITNADVSLRGGNSSSNYMLSAGYYNENGIITNSYFKRYSVRINSEHKLGKRLKVGENLQLTYKQNSGPDTYSSQTGLIFSALRFNPAIPVHNPDGSWGTSKASNELGDINNPVYTAETTDTWTKNYRMLASVYAELEIMDGLTLRANYGFDGSMVNQFNFAPKVLDQTRARDHAELFNRSESYNNQLSEIFLTYNKVLANVHHLTVTGGYSQQTFNGSWNQAERWGFNDESKDQLVLSNGNDIHDAKGNYFNANAIASGFIRGFYGFKDKYLLTVTFRADGSSRFAPDQRWGYFPAFSAGWRISDESFFKDNVKAVSNLKITGGWGQLGNQNVTEFQYLAQINKDRRYNFGETSYTGIWNSRLANPDITWEKAEMTNISLEAGFFQDKLTTTITWFNKNTNDMLVPAPEMDLHGTSAIPDRNLGQLNNKGWEIEVGYQGGNDKFHYNVSANASFIKNEVTKLYDPSSYIGSTPYGRQGQEISRTYVGQPLASYYGWKTDGIYQTADEINNDPNISKDPNKANIQPGDVRFLDTNGDNIVNDKDRVNLGSPNPKMVYGIQASAGYKGFDLSLSFAGVSGVKLYNADKMQGMDPNYPYNLYADALNRWHGAGTSNSVPRMTLGNANQNNRTSDRFVESGDYFSLRNASLGYTIPSKVWGRSGISDIHVYVAAQNLFMLTNYSGLTPQLGYSGSSDGSKGTSDGNRQRGVDVAAYPQARTFTFGATLNF
ncbi:TonB-linked outer membrane protein, SusC/RagA family [Chitinophaga ginsengisegetis]|uniref:TonB-linked outer membrane protein, SusC/RagA family n=1 Tax=Chitinophaga ginsengisegetis TaxID=393003 RepID=A0A1T5NA67_9BACT|nr:TonB-dependent receptor [Chitinophaga ginsengisegetis]MDR6568350.1 TonB-linked SusC/RagA family outer membrane protein [Chitinophaga ginsengisegetis]MDR6648419.1 TonB-linked SusC/RagA family outer membrane protein [Chitinophaga ginsengisegetis]MDR6654431.1 TonB-linked SusC/RagA family outer membrane protein [Chitinophaga ginsengisegetis]SKC97375.1 TonB-linked outer membrane protein, SusC/RagA family [Chitinophaga ginsengisegetis]